MMDNKERRVDDLFPTAVYLSEINQPTCLSCANTVLNTIYNTPVLKETLGETGGATTEDNLHLLPEFSNLTKEIQQEMNVYSEVYLGLAPNSVELTCMWSNVHSSGFRHQTHQHPNSYLSGVVYLNVPDVKHRGDIYFMDPRQAKNMQHGDFVANSSLSYREWQYTPETGRMILFPSWLEHGTRMFKSDKEEFRISISFNFVLVKASRHSFKLA